MSRSEEINSEQQKVQKLKQNVDSTEKAQETKAKLQENEAKFFSIVDQSEDLFKSVEASVQSPESKKKLDTIKDAFKDNLKQAAHNGQEAYQRELKGKDKSEYQAFLNAISTHGESINQKSAELRNAIPVFEAIEKSQQIFRKEAEPQIAKLEETVESSRLNKQQKKEAVIAGANEAIKTLNKARKEISSLTNLSPDLLQQVQTELKVIDAEIDEEKKYLIYYQNEDLCNKEEYKKYIKLNSLNGDIQFTDEFKKLPISKQQEIINAIKESQQKINTEIALDQCTKEHEKKFYEGQQLMSSAKPTEAKHALLNFYETENAQKEHTPDNLERLNLAKEYLKQIAKLELSIAAQRLNSLDQSISNYTGTLKLNTTAGVAKLNVEHMRSVLAMAMSEIENGRALTLDQAYQNLKSQTGVMEGSAIDRFQKGFGGADPIFDILKSEIEINNIKDPEQRKQKLIELGKKARELGMFELAKKYYETAFQQEINTQAQKLTREEFEKNVSPDFQKQFEERVKSWKEGVKAEFIKKFKEEHHFEPTEYTMQEFEKKFKETEPKERDALYQSMISDAYGKALKAMVNTTMNGNPPPEHAADWRDAYGNTFVNLEQFDTKWYQFYKFTDEEWNFKKYQYIVDLSLLIIAGATAGLSATVTVGARAAIVDALGGAAMSEAGQTALQRGGVFLGRYVIEQIGAKEAAKLGIRSAAEFAVETAAFTTTEGLLNGAVKGDYSNFSSPEAFLKAWGNGALMMGSCKVGGSLFNRFAVQSDTMAGRLANLAGSTSTEIATMNLAQLSLMAASGEEITEERLAQMTRENVLMSVGLRAGHHLSGLATHDAEASQMASFERDKDQSRENGKSETSQETESEFKNVDSKRINDILKNNHYSPEKLLETLSRSPQIKILLESDSQVTEGYTIKQHTEKVLKQFEHYFSDKQLPGKIDTNFMRLFLSLHDIGKPRAIEKGDKSLQHEETAPIIKELFLKTGFSEEQAKLASVLVNGDPIGKLLSGKGTPNEVAEDITKMAKDSGKTPTEITELLEIFYKCDAGSYTKDAGGIESLDAIFNFDRTNRTLEFSLPFEQRFKKLKQLTSLMSLNVSEVDTYRENPNDTIRHEYYNLETAIKVTESTDIELSSTQKEQIQRILINGERLISSFEYKNSVSQDVKNKITTSVEKLKFQLHKIDSRELLKDPNKKLLQLAELNPSLYNKIKPYLDTEIKYNDSNIHPTLINVIINSLEFYEKQTIVLTDYAKSISRNPETLNHFKEIFKNDPTLTEFVSGNVSIKELFQQNYANTPIENIETELRSNNKITFTLTEKLRLFITIQNNIDGLKNRKINTTKKQEFRRIMDDALSILQENQIGSELTQGMNSAIWGGLETSRALLSSAELRRRNIIRLSGEGEIAGGTTQIDMISFGEGIDGFGTALAYGDGNSKIPGYINPQYLDEEHLINRVYILENVIANLDGSESNNQYWALFQNGLSRSALQNELAEHRQALQLRSSTNNPPEKPYGMVLGFRKAPNHQFDSAGREYGGALSGEVALYTDVYSLENYLDSVYVPMDKIEDARKHLVTIFGEEKAKSIKIHSIEGGHLLSGRIREGLVQSTYQNTYTVIDNNQRVRFDLLQNKIGTNIPYNAIGF